MIISHQHKFIFIKTTKTAGTSIEAFLSRLCDNSDIVTPIYPPIDSHFPRNYRGFWNPLPQLIRYRGRGILRLTRQLIAREKFYNHIPARIVRQRIPESIWDEYFKFCVERNPWDKTLSHYHMLNDRATQKFSLDEYIERGHFCMNFPKYVDDDGTLLVDRVIKFESLADELGEVFARLKIPFDGNLGVRAKSDYRKDRSTYRDVLTKSQRQILDRAFAVEIRMHGYQY